MTNPTTTPRDGLAPTFASVRVVTDDVPRMVDFYERVIGLPATWSTDVFAEVNTETATLAVAGIETMALFGGEVARAAANRTMIIEFLVADVDADFARVSNVPGLDLVQEPTTMPWGNRSLLFRDPDANLVNLFTPVTPEAIAKFRR